MDESIWDGLQECNDLDKNDIGTVTGIHNRLEISYISPVIKDLCSESKASIWVVGDSTLALFHDDWPIPRVGYGTQLENYFNAEVFNLAHSGASSRDFTTLPEYRTLLEGSSDVPPLGHSDGKCFLLIGFGHNDEKPDARFTDADGDISTPGSFANSLYVSYIRPALERNVIPVLCTPIARLSEDNRPEGYSGRCGHITPDGGNYPKAILDLAASMNLEFVDMTSATKKMYIKLGTGAEKLFANDGQLDRTHTNLNGARINAWLVSALSKETAPSLYRWSKKEATPAVI